MSGHLRTYHQHKSSNITRSMLLLSTMVVLLVVLVLATGHLAGLSGPVITGIAAVVAVGAPLLSWYRSDALVIAMTRAKEVDLLENPRLHNLVEEVALAAGLPKPRVYMVIDDAPNAFATGRDPEHGVVAFTSGLLNRLDRAELEGVVAHELAHIKNRDTTVAAVAAATAGALAIVSDLAFRLAFIGGRDSKSAPHPLVFVGALLLALLAPVAGLMLQAAVSRRRESLADATAVEFTRNPAGLRSALEKLDADSTVVRARSRTAAHVWLESPLTHRGLDRVFATHPPLSERIADLAILEGLHPHAPVSPHAAPPPVPQQDWSYPAPPQQP